MPITPYNPDPMSRKNERLGIFVPPVKETSGSVLVDAGLPDPYLQDLNVYTTANNPPCRLCGVTLNHEDVKSSEGDHTICEDCGSVFQSPETRKEKTW